MRSLRGDGNGHVPGLATMDAALPLGIYPAKSAREQFADADARMAARMIEQDKLAKEPKRDRLGKFKRK